VITDVQKNGYAFAISPGFMLNLTNIIIQNSAQSAIQIQNASVSLDNCTVINGKQQDGGVIRASRSIILINDCLFMNNRVTGYGGVIYTTDYSNISITDSTFAQNHADSGGCVYAEESNKMVISDCTFHHNTASTTDDGAACIFMQGSGSLLNVSGSTFHANVGGSGAAAKLFVGPHAEFENCTFSNLVAVGAGGAIFAEQSVGVVVTDCTFKDNVAVSNGGAIYSYDAKLWVHNSHFLGNKAQIDGGAIATGEEAYASFDDSTFFNNSATFGGAIYVEYSSRIRLLNCFVEENSANMGHGGGLFCSDSKIFINDTTVVSNYATDADSNLYCSNFPAYTWCTVTGDTAWNSKCGQNFPSNSSLWSIPTLAIVGIVFVVLAFCVFFILGAFWVKVKIQRKTLLANKTEWTKSSQVETPKEKSSDLVSQDTTTLLTDYD